MKYEAAILLFKCDPSDDMPCVLHLHERVIEKVMKLIFIASLNEASSSNNGIRLQRTIDIADAINAIAFGTQKSREVIMSRMTSKKGK
jgi:hypothetical protein